MTLRIYCPSCGAEIRNDSGICPTCGLTLNQSLEDDATRRLESDRAPRSKTTSYDSIDNARFVPGAILCERYRIVGLLGKGGMGEVYRADDLKLGQPVALKFLPEHLHTNSAALARFLREVRVARQVSHKNVCRVYDIGETDGRHFLSMEYIKGEELSSLLRRIGRLPTDKATQLARQICAGLNAAHDAGVLHRDLKPANVMIDGDGNARVLDFGIAGLAEEFGNDELAAGTPAYMAPEQLEGKPFTIRSDIYSLGLLLYELFTSRRAFDAPTLGDLLKLRRSNPTPTTPTSIVKDLDPLIERVIDRCLQTDPGQRPASALQVAAALPGGDPIAAALAAGETPSPEMVAAAPMQGILRPAVAGALFVSFLLITALNCWLTKYTSVYRLTTLDKSPEVLRAHATDVIKKLGYTDAPLDRADGVVLKRDYLDYLARNDQSPNRWQKMRSEGPGPYRFWYRQSPRYFQTMEEIEVDRPALDVSGMTSIYLDMSGRLHWFMGVPPQREPQTESPGVQPVDFDWSVPFREAGLDIANFQPVASTWIPLHAYDSRAAWDGSDPAQPAEKIHVEAAAFRGKPVYFETIYPWDQPLRQEQPPQGEGQKILIMMLIVITLIALVGSFVLARRNLQQGRGDRKGATRVALVFLASRMLEWLFVEPHNGLPEREFDVFFLYLSSSMFSSTFLWLLYVALEPFVRKRWPTWIISWSRLLAGDFRNPLVGRDILIGAVVGACMSLTQLLAHLSPRLFGQGSLLTMNPGSAMLSTHIFFFRFTTQLSAALFLAFVATFLLLLFLAVLRRELLALVLLWLLLTIMTSLISSATWFMVPFVALSNFLLVYALKRFGLLALCAALFFAHLSIFYPMTTELTAWYAIHFTVALVIALALAAYGFYVSLGGQKLLSGRLLEE
ncbi:MAG TPA: serine/threonine-protein kinase [Pyrinomonadaceae bacterium]|nr:serine/threonine-protein kinase [Pyrinomonadaceae bacterium]